MSIGKTSSLIGLLLCLCRWRILYQEGFECQDKLWPIRSASCQR